jgi:hypothetical protein
MAEPITYLFNPHVPSDSRYLATQSTAFGTSSLAIASENKIVYDNGKKHLYREYSSTGGNGVHNGNTVYDTDKSPLGIQWYESAKGTQFHAKNPKVATVPNIYSLRRDTLL